MLKSHSSLLTEASKYAVVGGICTALDLVLLYCFTYFLNFNYLISSVLSFSAGALLNYFICTAWIFEFSRIQNRFHEFYFYGVITAAVLLANTALMWFLTSILSIYFIFSKLISIFFTYVLNFSLRKWLLHTVRNP